MQGSVGIIKMYSTLKLGITRIGILELLFVAPLSAFIAPSPNISAFAD